MPIKRQIYGEKTVSDILPKKKCKEWLESKGFKNVKLAKKEKCDLIARKDGKPFYIEVKYSSKKEGEFFGTVMLTEMHAAIVNKKNYLFLICRGRERTNNWFFKLFSVKDFLKYCTLTTPIFHYRLSVKNNHEIITPKFGRWSTLASPKLIKRMWQDFSKWRLRH